MDVFEKQFRTLVKNQVNEIKTMVIEPAGLCYKIGEGHDGVVRVITERSPEHGYIFPNVRMSYFKRIQKEFLKDKV